jgi:leader peptidase (prepilin peptidase)/N-methyltransferase
MLMIIVALAIVGLGLGSFANALVWRVKEQEEEAGKNKPDRQYLEKLSIAKGRSMCPYCKHKLASKDLIPVLSWLILKGKCRYCDKPIPIQYPVIELATAGLFAASYVWWPYGLHGSQIAALGLWLLVLTGLMALLVYDMRWKLLPNRIIYPLFVLAGVFACLEVLTAFMPLEALVNTILAVLVGGGIFYGLFQLSGGKWIGGGDVKLGWLLGLILGTPARSFLLLFLASLLGTAISLPLLATNRLKRTSTIPFGPFLIIAAIIVQLFGRSILMWYQRTFLTV